MKLVCVAWWSVALCLALAGLVGCDEEVAPEPWSRSFDARPVSEAAVELAPTPDGGVVVAAVLATAVDFGGGRLGTPGGGPGLYVAGFERDGRHRWSRLLGEVHGFSQVDDLVVDGEGTVAIAMKLAGELETGAISLAPANGLGDGVVVVLEPDGSPRWAAQVLEGGEGFQTLPKRIAMDAAGNVVVAGDVRGAVTCAEGTPLPHDSPQADLTCAFVARFDAQGRATWLRAFDVEGLEAVHGLAVDRSGERIVVTGSFRDEVDFGGGTLVSRGREDVYVFELDEAGRHRWSAAFGGGGGDIGRAAAFDDDGTLWLAGEFFERIDAGGGALTTTRSEAAFVARFGTDGGHLASSVLDAPGWLWVDELLLDGEDGATIAGRFRNGLWEVDGERIDAGVDTSTDVLIGVDGGGAVRWIDGVAEGWFTLEDAVATGDGVLVAGTFQGRLEIAGATHDSEETSIFLSEVSAR